jgi:hypothetical protein
MVDLLPPEATIAWAVWHDHEHDRDVHVLRRPAGLDLRVLPRRRRLRRVHVADHRLFASVGSVGDAYDNALAESFLDSSKPS